MTDNKQDDMLLIGTFTVRYTDADKDELALQCLIGLEEKML